MKTRMLMIVIVAVAIAAAACGDPAGRPDGPGDGSTSTTDGGATTTTSGDPSSRPAGDWILASGVPTVDGFPISLSFDDATFGGRAACNRYGGSLVLGYASLGFTDMSMTEMGCEPAVMESERSYLDALARVTSWEILDGQLHLRGPDPALVFDPAPEVPTEALVGTTWILDTVVRGDMAFAAVGDEATLVLSDAGAVMGGTGCRTLTGRWVEADGQIMFPEFAADGDCPEDVREQDSAVVSVLGDGFRASVEGDLLTLTSMGEEGLVYRAASG